MSQRRRPLLPSPSCQTGVLVPMGSVKRSRGCDGESDAWTCKRVKVGEIQRMESEIREEFGLGDETTIKDLDRLLAVQRAKVKEAQLEFVRGRLKERCGAQEESVVKRFENAGDGGISSVRPTDLYRTNEIGMNGQSLLSGCAEEPLTMGIGFDWSSFDDCLNPVLAFSSVECSKVAAVLS